MNILLIFIFGIISLQNINLSDAEPYFGIYSGFPNKYSISNAMASVISNHLETQYALITATYLFKDKSDHCDKQLGVTNKIYELYKTHMKGWDGCNGAIFFGVLDIATDGSCIWDNIGTCMNSINIFFSNILKFVQEYQKYEVNPELITNLTNMYSKMNETYQQIFLNIRVATNLSSIAYDDVYTAINVFSLPTNMQPTMDNLISLSASLKNQTCYVAAYVKNMVVTIFACGQIFSRIDDLMNIRAPWRNYSLIVFLTQTRSISTLYLSFIMITNRTVQYFGSTLGTIVPSWYPENIVGPNWHDAQRHKHDAALNNCTENLGYIYMYMYDIIYIFTFEITVAYNAILVELIGGVYDLLDFILRTTTNTTGSVNCANTASWSLVFHIYSYFAALDVALYTRLWRLWVPYPSFVTWVFGFQYNWTIGYYGIGGAWSCFGKGSRYNSESQREKVSECLEVFVINLGNYSDFILLSGETMADTFYNQYRILANDTISAMLTVLSDANNNLKKINDTYKSCDGSQPQNPDLRLCNL